MNFEGAVTWAFEFEDQPYFAGFRVLSTNGIALPVLNVFRMFGMMGGQRLAVESSGEVGLEPICKQGVAEARHIGPGVHRMANCVCWSGIFMTMTCPARQPRVPPNFAVSLMPARRYSSSIFESTISQQRLRDVETARIAGAADSPAAS